MDSASAFFVTQTLRGLSRDGRTVIASIHQPSSEVFELFDRLYLLSGGKTVYFGKASEAYEVSLREVYCQFIFDFTNELYCWFLTAVFRTSWFPLPCAEKPIWSLSEVHKLRFWQGESYSEGINENAGMNNLFLSYFLAFSNIPWLWDENSSFDEHLFPPSSQFVMTDDPLEKTTTAEAIRTLIGFYSSSHYYYTAKERVEEISKVVSNLVSLYFLPS